MNGARVPVKMPYRFQTGLPYALSWLFTAVFVTPWCGVLFGCGCTWLWAGLARFCNIHRAAGPHCPWCMHGAAIFMLAAAAIAVAQSAAVVWLQRRGRGWVMATLAGVAAFFPAGFLAAWAFALHDHVPLALSLLFRA